MASVEKNIENLTNELDLLRSAQKKEEPDPSTSSIVNSSYFGGKNEEISLIEQISENIYNVTVSEFKSLIQETINSQKDEEINTREPGQYSRALIDAVCVRFIQTPPKGNTPLNMVKSYVQKTFRVQRYTKFKDLIKYSIKEFVPKESATTQTMLKGLEKNQSPRDNFELVNKSREPFRERERTIEETLIAFRNNPAIFYVIPKDRRRRGLIRLHSETPKPDEPQEEEEEEEKEMIQKETHKDKNVSDFLNVFPRFTVTLFAFSLPVVLEKKPFINFNMIKKKKSTFRNKKYKLIQFLIVFAFTFLSLIGTFLKIEPLFWNQIYQEITARFDPRMYSRNFGGNIDRTYQDIQDTEDVYEYIEKVLSMALFGDEEEQEFTNRKRPFSVYGNTVFQQIRLKTVDCKFGESYTCYPTKISDSTLSKEPLSSITGKNETDVSDWAIFKTDDQTGIESEVEGDFWSYPTSGYTVEFDDSTSLSDFIDVFEMLKSFGFLAPETKGLILRATFVPEISSFIFPVIMVFETLPVGIIKAHPPQILKYDPEFKQDIWSYVIISLKMALVLALVLILAAHVAVLGAAHLVSFEGILALVLIIMEASGFSMSLFFTVAVSDSSEDTGTFEDFFHKARWERNIRIFDAFLSFTACVNLVTYLRYFPIFKTMMAPYVASFYDILVYMAFFLVWVISSVLILGSLIGPRDYAFVGFSNAFVSVLLMSIGRFQTIYEIHNGFEKLLLYLEIISMSLVGTKLFVVIISNTTRKLALYKKLPVVVSENWTRERMIRLRRNWSLCLAVFRAFIRRYRRKN